MCLLKTSCVNSKIATYPRSFLKLSRSLPQHSPKKISFSQESSLVMPLPLYKPLLKSSFSTPHTHIQNINILISMSISSLRHDPIIFSPPKHHHKLISPNSIMAACVVDTSRTESSQTNPLSHDPNTSDHHHHLYNCMKFYRPNCSDLNSCLPISQNHSKTIHTNRVIDEDVEDEEGEADLWLKMQDEAKSDVDQEPILSNYYYNSILAFNSLETALSNHLSMKLSNSALPSTTLFELFKEIFSENPEIMKAVREDLKAVKERDPACISYVHCFLNFKGFLACQSHRLAHKLWTQNRKVLALLIQNRVSEIFAVDIHPGAKIGGGILFDHATGVVIGETAVIGNNVSILHNVTLGGTGKVSGDRHPKIGDGVLIGAGTCVLGSVWIGEGSKIGAGSVVLKELPPRTTAVGNPARLIGGKENPTKLDKIPSLTMDHTSHISEWSDYVI